jgi:hypothetical protein
MGYMGFGMNKDVYTRKARRPSTKIRDFFRKETVSKTIPNSENKAGISKEQLDLIKVKIRKKATRKKRINVIMMLVTIAVLYFLFWYFVE